MVKMENILKVTIEISFGEFLDRMSILKIKKERIKNKHKLKYVKKEYNALNKGFRECMQVCDPVLRKQIKKLYKELYEINNKLWDIEDAIRVKEKKEEFDHSFVNIARKVYINNDERFRIKNAINELLNSPFKEIKDY